MKKLFLFSVVIFSVLFNRQTLGYGSYCKDTVSKSALLQLKQYLFCQYDFDIRPTQDHRNATTVSFGLYIHQFRVEEFTSTVDFNVWMRLVWTDQHLTWLPLDFEDISGLHVMSYEIWTPDIVLHSTTNMGIDMEMPTVECWLNHTGRVYCIPSTVFTTFCEPDHTWWPYDTMDCMISIASWSHSDNEIKLIFETVDEEGQLAVNVYDTNTEWEITHISQSKRLMDTKFGLDFTSNQLTYRILLKRHSSMYGVVYVNLTVVLMTMTLMVLWLDPMSTERMVIANSNFVLHLLGLLNVQWTVPFNGSRAPELIFFYENSLVLATFSLVLTTILRYVQELNTEPPIWVSSTTVSILKSRAGQLFLVSILDPKVSARIELNADDNTNLVSSDKKETTWRYTSILIGWLAFLCISFVYIILFILFLPTNRSVSVLPSNT